MTSFGLWPHLTLYRVFSMDVDTKLCLPICLSRSVFVPSKQSYNMFWPITVYSLSDREVPVKGNQMATKVMWCFCSFTLSVFGSKWHHIKDMVVGKMPYFKWQIEGSVIFYNSIHIMNNMSTPDKNFVNLNYFLSKAYCQYKLCPIYYTHKILDFVDVSYLYITI